MQAALVEKELADEVFFDVCYGLRFKVGALLSFRFLKTACSSPMTSRQRRWPSTKCARSSRLEMSEQSCSDTAA